MLYLRNVQSLLEQPERLWNLLPETIEDVTREDADYHRALKEEWLEANQVLALRNLVPHRQAVQWVIEGLEESDVILEFGSGVGFDAQLVLEALESKAFQAYLLSEIDPELVGYAKRMNARLHTDARVLALCLDGMDLRLESNQVNRIFCVAALHHLPDISQALGEMDRVAQPGARFVFAMEPNRRWLSFIGLLRPWYRRFLGSPRQSAADEKAEGFTQEELWELGAAQGWICERVQPQWFFTGFLHYGLEALFRLFHLQKRIRLPLKLEHTCIKFDSLLFRIPGFSHWSFHYSAAYRKSSLAKSLEGSGLIS